MQRNAGTFSKNKKNLMFNCTKTFFNVYLVVLILLLSLNILIVNNNDTIVIADNTYVPPSPLGATSGNINVDYEYIFHTTDVGSYWMFDWGDGNYSNWIRVGESDTYVSQIYSWDSYGVYNIRIKHNSTLIGESSWSQPLVVTIAIPSDLDEDGWDNDIEAAYETDPEDSNDYPLDTDGDGKPDESSSDESYTGDSDDDNDGILDTIELSIGSNPKNKDNIVSIVIKDITYYLFDNDGDGTSYILYNSQTDTQTKTAIEDGKVCLDINNDGSWDYTYSNGNIARYKGPFPWLYIIVIIILVIIAVIFLLFKTGVIFLYEDEYGAEE